MVEEKETLYSRLAKQVAEIEKEAQRPPVGTVDISASFASNVKKGGITYQELLDKVGEVERHGGVFQKQRVPAAKAQPMQQQVRGTEVLQQPVKIAVKESAKSNAQKELSELTRALPVHAPVFGASGAKAGEQNLVLPSLSIPDQIAELERILEGLTAGIFTADDISTVRAEVYGLAMQVNKEKKELEKSKKSVDPDSVALWVLRDQRISDLLARLKKAKAR